MIILDMDMPKNCNECPLVREDSQLRDYCGVLPEEGRIWNLMERLKNCPIKELPQRKVNKRYKTCNKCGGLMKFNPHFDRYMCNKCGNDEVEK